MRTWTMMAMVLLAGMLMIGGCSCFGGGEATPPETAGGVAQLTGSENFTVTDCKKAGSSYTVTVNKTLVISNITLDGEEVKMPAFEPRSGAPKPYLEAAGADGETLLKDIEAAVKAVAGGGSVPASDREFSPFTFGGMEVTIIQPRESSGSSSSGERASGSRSSSSRERGSRAISKAATHQGMDEGGSASSGSSSSSNATRQPTVLAALVLNDSLKITGLRIMKSSSGDGYWISWPSKKQGTRYIPSVALTDNATKKKIEEALLAAYAEKAELDPATVTLSQRGGSGAEGEEGGSKPAGAVYISAIAKDGERFTATLWNEISISGITIGEKVAFPNSGNERFPFVKAPYQTAPTAVAALTAAIEAFAENGSFDKGTQAALEVTNVRATRATRGGYGEVTFNNAITIASFRITDKDGEITVELPSVKKGSTYVPVIKFRTASIWADLQEQIIDKYKAAPPARPRSGGSSSASGRSSRSSGGDEGGEE